MLVLLVAVVTGAWADGIVCTASDLGKVLCTDGSIYENVNAAKDAGKTAAAVIVYVDETNKKGLAIALADEGSMNWSTAVPARVRLPSREPSGACPVRISGSRCSMPMVAPLQKTLA